jgi:hypothetical protein
MRYRIVPQALDVRCVTYINTNTIPLQICDEALAWKLPRRHFCLTLIAAMFDPYYLLPALYLPRFCILITFSALFAPAYSLLPALYWAHTN